MSRRRNKVPAEFLLCRDLRHAWKPVDAWREGKTFVEQLRCERCNCRKDRTYDSKGYLIPGKQNLIYPAGYLMPKGEGRMTAADLAATRMERLK